MQVKLNVPKTKAKFWPPLQDIHCHGNHLSFGKAHRLEKHTKKNILNFFGENPMKKTKINMGKPPQKKKKNLYLETLWGEPYPEEQKMEEPKKYCKKKIVVGVVRRVLPKKPLKTKKKIGGSLGRAPWRKQKKIGETKKRWKNIFWDYWLTLPKTSVFFCFGFCFFRICLFCLYGALPKESQNIRCFSNVFSFFAWGKRA